MKIEWQPDDIVAGRIVGVTAQCESNGFRNHRSLHMPHIACDMAIKIVSPAEHHARRQRLRMLGCSDDDEMEIAKSGRPTILDVQCAVAACAGIRVEEMSGNNRPRCVRARSAAVLLIMRACGISSPTLLGNKFHLTADMIRLARRRAMRLATDTDFCELVGKSCAHLRVGGFKIV